MPAACAGAVPGPVRLRPRHGRGRRAPSVRGFPRQLYGLAAREGRGRHDPARLQLDLRGGRGEPREHPQRRLQERAAHARPAAQGRRRGLVGLLPAAQLLHRRQLRAGHEGGAGRALCRGREIRHLHPCRHRREPYGHDGRRGQGERRDAHCLPRRRGI